MKSALREESGVDIDLPTWLTDFQLQYVSEGVWLRETHFAQGPASYYVFRRIVEADGSRTAEAYAKYQREAAPTGLVFEKP